ncbi:hypothetical protein AVW15_06105 [Chelatococcus daeguensis]|nr:hypothetical protein AVW15_06105 [Chelatococcus daeguensis]
MPHSPRVLSKKAASPTGLAGEPSGFVTRVANERPSRVAIRMKGSSVLRTASSTVSASSGAGFLEIFN